MVNPPGLIVFCAPLKAGSQGRGGGGAWAVAEGKKIETNFLHESHQWTKGSNFCQKGFPKACFIFQFLRKEKIIILGLAF
jgi:hypothetical protein